MPADLQKLADQRGTEGDSVASRLLNSLGTPWPNEAIRCARAVVAAVLDDESPSSLADLIFDELAQVSVPGATTTEAAMATLMSGLAGITENDVVLDPACGEGRLLLAAGRRRPDAVLIGMDREDVCIDTTAALMRLNGLDADLDKVEDSLADSDPIRVANVVLLDPPVAKGTHVRRWMTLATRLCPDGRIVSILPGSSLRAGRREWREFGDRTLAVVACPPQSKTDTGEAPAIWVLGRRVATLDVLIVDAAGKHAGS